MDDLDVALVVPLQGPAGLFGPSAELCARLAQEEINADGGVLGRELRLLLVDGGAPPHGGRRPGRPRWSTPVRCRR